MNLSGNTLKPFLLKGVAFINLFFVFWILTNGIQEGFAGTFLEKASYISLMLLLSLNSFLLFRKSK